jgi:hypothetical protein
MKQEAVVNIHLAYVWTVSRGDSSYFNQHSSSPSGKRKAALLMAKINAGIPEPTPEYKQENQRQIAQAIQTVQDQLNTSLSTGFETGSRKIYLV